MDVYLTESIVLVGLELTGIDHLLSVNPWIKGVNNLNGLTSKSF